MPPHKPAIIQAIIDFDRDGASRILVAVSGGADSIALLHALVASDIHCGVAHLDHTTREGASTEDAQWVADLAQQWDIPCHSGQVDVPALAESSRESFEEVARRVRYDFLSETALTHNYDAIATAHHLDDQAETVLMRVLRGTSVTGLGGIHQWSDWKGTPLLRPILNVTRADILDYLRDEKLTWREDTSNTDESFMRNRVRHTLMPLLEESFNPGVKNALDRLARVARDEDALLAEWSAKALDYCLTNGNEIQREAFRKLDPALRRRVMLEIVRKAGGLEELDTIDAAVDFVCWKGTGKHLDIGGGNQLSNGRETTLVINRGDSPPTEDNVQLTVPGECNFNGATFTATILDQAPAVPLSEYCTPTRQVFAAESLPDTLTIRHRKPGDRIALLGLDGTRKLKDYFGDLGLPLEVRDTTPLILAGDEIIWITGHAVSRDHAVTDSTQRLIQIEIRHED